jgi:hypothetical protein
MNRPSSIYLNSITAKSASNSSAVASGNLTMHATEVFNWATSPKRVVVPENLETRRGSAVMVVYREQMLVKLVNQITRLCDRMKGGINVNTFPMNFQTICC